MEVVGVWITLVSREEPAYRNRALLLVAEAHGDTTVHPRVRAVV